MATLKISDLSVGDWVEWKVYDKSYDILVTQITDTLIRGVHDGIEYGVLLKQISPIPITPEILEANGWQRNEEDEYMEYYGDPTSGIAHTKGTYHYRLEAPEVSVVCYFVHQLQHALRLAGVEKEIVMPNK